MSALAMALLAAPPCLPLFMSLLNVATWSRGKPGGQLHGKVSVLVPARNEAANIEATVRAIAASRHPVHEIIVYDDQSSDDTPHILANLQREFSTLRVVNGVTMPAGWVGKPHACHQLRSHASGDLLVFVDADTRLSPEAIERIVALAEREDASVVTAMPRQELGSWSERLLLPLLVLTYTSWFPLALVSRSRDPRFTAANGQLLAVRSVVYDRIGGFASVGQEIVDDVAFCRHAKRCHERVVFADGTHMATCRMYGSASDLWDGFSKNIYEGIGGTLPALAVTLVLYAGCFIAPYVALFVALLFVPSLLMAAALGVVANVLLRVVLAARYQHPWWAVAAHPVAVSLLLAMAINSFRWSRRGRLLWSGRSYAPRRARLEAAS